MIQWNRTFHCKCHTNLRLIQILYQFNLVHIFNTILKDQFYYYHLQIQFPVSHRIRQIPVQFYRSVVFRC